MTNLTDKAKRFNSTGPLYKVLRLVKLERLEIALLSLAINKYKSINNTRTINELVNIAFNSYVGLIAPYQEKTELAKFLGIIKSVRPTAVMEIGTFNGGTLFLMSHVIADDATIISVDLPEGKFGGGYPKWKVPLYQSFKLPKQQIHLLRLDSHDPETLSKINSILGRRKLDLLFLDGDHSYEGVKKDYEIYKSLVCEKGIIALHDIAVHPVATGCEVNRFWNELKQSGLKTEEIIAKNGQDWAGIGIVYQGKI